jgi:anaerobic selenocysteine-containing dehydrogenase
MRDGTAKALICLGGNLAVALPDPQAVFPAFRKLDLAVHMATKLNRSHLLLAKESIILPVLGRTELDVQQSGAQSVTVEDSMSMVHASRGRLQPASEHLRSEPAIIAGMAHATLGSRYGIDWEGLVANYDRIRAAIAGVFPDFGDYNARIRLPGGFHLTVAAMQRKWNTPSGKAEFLPAPGLGDAVHMAEPDILVLMTIRSHDQYNTTIYGLDDRYRGVFGRRDILFMNESDLTARGLRHGDTVAVETASGGHLVRNLTAIAYYPETNGLVPLAYHDKRSGTPAYKGVPVRVRMEAAA